jgi:hypothetical protein
MTPLLSSSLIKLAVEKLKGFYTTPEAVQADIDRFRASLRYSDEQLSRMYETGEVDFKEVCGVKLPDPRWAMVHDPARLHLVSLQLLMKESFPDYLERFEKEAGKRSS